MNWGKVLLAGLVAGIAKNIVDFVLHGMVMSNTYIGLPEVFAQEQGNPVYFVLISVCQGIAAAILFSKTRNCWAAGAVGGATFGALVGLVEVWSNFYDPIVIEGFPYYLAWCHGGIAFIGFAITGAVLGLIIKRH